MNFTPLIILFVCFLLGFPIAFSLMASVILYFALDPFMSVNILVQRMVASTESVSLMAIPFFVTAGAIMNYSGISSRLMALADALVGHMTGGLGQVNVVLSTLMGGVSGSGAADAAMECKLLVPEMEKRGYDIGFSAAVTAASACITPIIPPSVALVIFAFICGQSTGKMLCAGYIPGLLLCVSMMLVVHIISKKRGYLPSREKMASGSELWKLAKEGFWALLLPFGLIMGLRVGIFSATEGGALMCVYSFIIGMFVYKELKPKHIPIIIRDAVISTASVMIILCAANVFSYYLSWERIPTMLSEAIINMSSSKYVFLILVNVLFLVLGMFLDGTASMIILAPLFTPIAVSLGVSPIQFGIILALNVAIGAITPPFGIYIYIVSSTLHLKTERIIVNLLPFVLCAIVVLLLVTFIPQLSLLIPNLVY